MEQMFDPGLWAVFLFFLAVIGAGYYFLMHWGRSTIQKDAANQSRELRQLESRGRALQLGLQGYSSGTPEPFGERAGGLHAILEQTLDQLANQRVAYVQVQEGLPHRGRNFIEELRFSPIVLTRLHKELNTISGQLGVIQENVCRLEQGTQELQQLGWYESLTARQVQTDLAQIEIRLQVLRERKLRGTSFEILSGGIEECAAGMNRLPDYFLHGSEDSVLAQADKAAVVAAHQILVDLRPTLAQHTGRLEQAETRLGVLDSKAAQLHQALSQAEQALLSLPTGVDGSTFLVRFERSQSDWQALKAGLSHPELEKLDAIETGLDQQAQSVEGLTAEIRQARQALESFERMRTEIGQRLKEISSQYSSLGTASAYRIIWSRTSTALATLNQGYSQLGAAGRKHLTADLDKELENTNQLALALEGLADRIQSTASQRTQLLELLSGYDLNQGSLWAENGLKIMTQVVRYNPDNWQRADRIGGMSEELQALINQMTALGTGNPGQGIAEELLPERLESVYRLNQSYQVLRARLNLVEARLSVIQQAESRALQDLQEARDNLIQVGFIIKSNPDLRRIAGQEPERFQNQIDKQLTELTQPDLGTVDSKVRQASGLVIRITQGFSEWLERLDADTMTRVKTLTASLTRIDSIAPLEDSPVETARRLLSTPAFYNRAGSASKPEIKMNAAVAEFKRRSEYDQSCAAAILALQEIENPVIESYNTANERRQAVQAQLAELGAWRRQGRNWPPVAVEYEAEYQQAGQVESEWLQLKSQPVKAIDLVKKLGDCSREYQSLAERMRQVIEQGKREQNVIVKLEKELTQYLARWSELMDAYPEKREVRADIDDLLSGTQTELNGLQTRYTQGRLDYTSVEQALSGLHRKVRLYQVALDERRVIDIQGRVIVSRDSQRAPGEW